MKIHFVSYQRWVPDVSGRAACGAPYRAGSFRIVSVPGDVIDCARCRRSAAFRAAEIDTAHGQARQDDLARDLVLRSQRLLESRMRVRRDRYSAVHV